MTDEKLTLRNSDSSPIKAAICITLIQAIPLVAWVVCLHALQIKNSGYAPQWALSLFLVIMVFGAGFLFKSIRNDGSRKVAKAIVDLLLAIWATCGILSYKPFVSVTGIDVPKLVEGLGSWAKPIPVMLLFITISARMTIIVLDGVRDWTAATRTKV